MSDKILSRGDVIRIVAADNGVQLPTNKVDSVIKAFEAAVARQLEIKGEIRMAGFGTFKTSERGERTSRNPRTGEPVTVAARTVARFVPGKGLKEAADSGAKAAPAKKEAAPKAAKAESKAKKPAAKGKKK